MSKQLNEDMFDVRRIDRYLAEGALTQEDVKAYLDSLEDCSDNVETSGVQMVAHDRSRRALSSEEGGQEEDEA